MLAASEQLLICGLLLIRIRVWSPCSLHSVRLIMPRNVSPSLLPSYPHWSWEVGCRGKFGTNPKGECYSQSPLPLWKEHNPTKNTSLRLAILQLLTSHMDQTYRRNFILLCCERKKSWCCDLLFHKRFMWQAHEATHPSICSWPQGQWAVFRTQTCPYWEQSWESLGKRNNNPKKVHILTIQTPQMKQNALLRCPFQRPSLVGTSLFPFVFHSDWQQRG